ncbi:hypothetical protein PHAVU_008G154700 [Phaseolus vulgaris]|uniref:Uncharacterized protein n=1 Tax=Phaseolus vulgaris TaxID=3885 RepID=V7B5T2_PHAVU|nr:hypothetical protein PHAVU_008G154700g [Phaseolus vulgaris]ESW12940.1 hypothetical protein PHAVU_008G154700g [Phaseolus vulgaris]
MEKLVQATMVNQKNNMAIIRNIEIQIRQMAKKIAEGQSGQILANTTTNPKEHCNKIITKSDKKNRRGRW